MMESAVVLVLLVFMRLKILAKHVIIIALDAEALLIIVLVVLKINICRDLFVWMDAVINFILKAAH